MFSNGVKWNEKKHSKIYKDYNKEYTNCAVTVFSPFLHDYHPYQIINEGIKCDYNNRFGYICLKPAANDVAEPIVQKRENEMSYMFLPAAFFVAVVSAFLVCAYVSFRKIIKLKDELEITKQKLLQASLNNNISLGSNEEKSYLN